MSTACASCGCVVTAMVHDVAAALAADDLDAALDRGLLDVAPCGSCTPACMSMVSAARDDRLAALAARERHRARARRLARREQEKAAARATPVAMAGKAALPVAAADVLARALARARGSER